MEAQGGSSEIETRRPNPTSVVANLFAIRLWPLGVCIETRGLYTDYEVVVMI